MRRDEALAVLAAHREELYSLGVKSLALFGSVARDEAGSESDVDLLVELERPAGLFKLIEVNNRLEQWLGCRVDLGTPDSLRDGVRPHVLKDIVHVP